MGILHALGRQVQRQLWPASFKMRKAQRKVCPHQANPEAVPATLAHGHAIGTGLVVGKDVGCCPWRIVVAHSPQGQQRITIVTGLVCQVVEVLLAIIVCSIKPQDFDVLGVQSFHGASCLVVR